jgi:tetratricopeptide (TPR) repeat protein
MSEKNLFISNLKLLPMFFSVALLFTGATFAQSINDDLKPAPKATPKAVKPKTVKPKAETKTVVKQAKTTKKVVRQPKQVAVKSSVKTIETAQVSTPVEPPVVTYSETPEQIINRFMNFEQSAGVTDKDWESVMGQTAKTLQENPNHLIAKAQSLVAQGQIAFNRRSFPAAITFFKSALQILPTSSLPLYGLGKVYLANGQAKAAEQSFKEALDRNEDFALAYKGMGDALQAQGEQKKAVKYFKKATETGAKKGSLP